MPLVLVVSDDEPLVNGMFRRFRDRAIVMQPLAVYGTHGVTGWPVPHFVLLESDTSIDRIAWWQNQFPTAAVVLQSRAIGLNGVVVRTPHHRVIEFIAPHKQLIRTLVSHILTSLEVGKDKTSKS